MLRAIPTEYRGVQFRSRLEARWARFFDNLAMTWFYEYEGYETETGFYLPDFWLPDVYLRSAEVKGIYLEVKPDDFGSTHDSLEEIGCKLHRGGILAAGFRCDSWGGWQGLSQLAPWWDDNMMIYKCHKCGAVKFEFSEGSYMDCPVCGESDYPRVVENILWAYSEASKHRFW